MTASVQNAKVSPGVVAAPEVKAAMEAMNLREWFTRVHEWFPGYSPLSLAPEYEVRGVTAASYQVALIKFLQQL
jgi:hypothetical protein